MSCEFIVDRIDHAGGGDARAGVFILSPLLTGGKVFASERIEGYAMYTACEHPAAATMRR